MIIRSTLRCSLPRRLAFSHPHILPKPRRFSTSSLPVPPPSSGPPASMLAAFTNELDRLAPKFEIHGSQIQIIASPAEFYETLKSKILAAEKRIFLSTLYIGKTEHELISTLQQALRAKPNLKLSILTDALRGTRESPSASCASLLAPLVAEFGPERVEIRMYHTPNLTGLRKKYIPKRINEGWGLQHMKLYGVDDEIIMSGANLSSDYFTNRQDRYHLFSSQEITSYFSSIHDAVSSLSFLLVPAPDIPSKYTLIWPNPNPASSPLDDPKAYITASSSILTPLIQPPSSSSKSQKTITTTPKANTTIYPLSQLTPNLPTSQDTSTELPAILHLLRTLSSPTFSKSSWTFTAGYFNPHPSLVSLLLSTSSAKPNIASSTLNTVITASPQANGFFGSKGVSGLLPPAYTLLSRRFLERAKKAGRGEDVELREWRRGTIGEEGGWTYHAKGLWVSLNPPSVTEKEGPAKSEADISIIGSSNYTTRSYTLDLEAGALILTTDPDLKRRLGEERDRLLEYTKRMELDDFMKPDRRVGIRVRVAMWIVQMVGGAL